MFRTLIQFVKSPVHAFPALAAAIGCVVSGYSTFNGIFEIFPEFAYSALAAFGLAAIIQIGMLTSTLAYRDQPRYRPMLVAIVAMTVLMSSFTSYVFYYRGFSEETIAHERRLARYESLRGWLVAARAQAASTLGLLQEAGAELDRRIDIEQRTGGGLQNVSSPYLQRLIAESDLRSDLSFVGSGSGERYRFLSSLATRIDAMESEVGESLRLLDGELETIADPEQVDHAALQAAYSRASAALAGDRIRDVRGELLLPAVDPAILDNRALVEEEYWQRAAGDLAALAPAAVVFAFIALFIDLMIVFFAFMAGDGQSSAARLPVGHWLSLAYGDDPDRGVREWLGALDGVRLQRGRDVYHRLDLRRLRGDAASQAGRFLRQDGYLQQVLMEDGVARWCLSDRGYEGLVELARSLERTPGAVASVIADGDPPIAADEGEPAIS